MPHVRTGSGLRDCPKAGLFEVPRGAGAHGEDDKGDGPEES